ncbi:aspartate aminotransferase family protein [Herpetosiphon gulosus]|uniref:4-aminobutyrate aminotransferase GabT n=1 Tax=Herpetosiphon gulosus TaxID=1973496 RepID=A0ABP9WVX9_9CHLR
MLPKIISAVPGPRSQALLAQLAASEAPSLTLPGGIVWAEAEGALVTDVDGNRYLDFAAAFGVVGIGHRHPAVLAAIQAQSERLIHGMGDVFAHEARIELVQLIKQHAPIADGRVFLAGGGAESIEIALKTAMLATQKPGVVAFTGGYHGLSYGALAATNRADFRQPFLPQLSSHVQRAPYPYPFRWREAGDCLDWALTTTEQLIKTSASPIGALIVEPVQGREGEIVPPDGWLRGLRQLCDHYEILLIADEIFTGWGRTGKWWGVNHDGIEPDLICMGKGMTGGLQIAACVGRAEHMAHWQVNGEPLHTGTFMGHPLACAGAAAAIRVLTEHNTLDQVNQLSLNLLRGLAAIAENCALVGDVRGRGLMIGLELVQADRITPNPAAVMHVVSLCQAQGVLVLGGGMHGNVLSLTPPFILNQAQVEYGLNVLQQALMAVAEEQK